MKKKSMRRGLTLLELMIVLIILVGLMAIVGPRLLGTQKKADVRTAQAQIGNINSALKLYHVDMKSYPSTEEGLDLLLNAPEDEKLAKSWDGPYVDGKKLPVDPWGHDFQYEFGSEEGSIKETSGFPLVYSLGPDGKANTTDDVGNTSEEDAEGDSSSSKKSTKE